MKPTRTWILVANGSTAKLHLSEGPGSGLQQIRTMTPDNAHARTQDIMADKPGRVFDSEGKGRHAMAYTSDPKQEERKAFAHQLVRMLEAHMSDFDQLVLVASPGLLGDLRKEMPASVKGKTTSELDHDLTAVSDLELARQVGKVIAI